MQNITGSPVEGDNFHGRIEDLERISRSILTFNDILLLSPRRTGKSSLSLEIINRMREKGWDAVRCNLEKATSEAQFIDEIESTLKGLKLPRRINKKLSTAVTNFRKLAGGLKIGSVEIPAPDAIPEWEDAMKALELALIHLANQDTPVLLVVDELPIFIGKLIRSENGSQRACNILGWLRHTQQECTRTGFSWFLCGSIGLDSQVEFLGIPGTISNFEIHDLGPMEPNEGKELLWKLSTHHANPIEMTTEVAEHILTRTGWAIPSYLQLLYHALSELPPAKRSTEYPTPVDVDAAYDHLLSANYASKFAPWDTRLDEPFIDPLDAKRARFLLQRIAPHPQGRNRSDLFELRLAIEPNVDREDFERSMRRVTLMLERDGYILRSGEMLAFRSPILRDYWLKNHVS